MALALLQLPPMINLLIGLLIGATARLMASRSRPFKVGQACNNVLSSPRYLKRGTCPPTLTPQHGAKQTS